MYDKLSEYGYVDTNATFKDKTSFKIGGKIKYYIEVYNIECLKKLIKFLNDSNIAYFIIGNGTNLLVSDEDFNIVVISLKRMNKYYQQKDMFIIESGVSASVIGTKITMLGYKNPLCLSLIPGSVGGAIYMNASAYNEEIRKYLCKVEYLDELGNVNYLDDFSDFSYRKSFFTDKRYIITKGFFKFEKDLNNEAAAILENARMHKKLTQPLNVKCAGSIFKNGKDYVAWKEIKKLNLDKKVNGDAAISSIHANIFINNNNASFTEMYSLIKDVKKEVFEKNNILLEEEIKIIKPQDITPYQ